MSDYNNFFPALDNTSRQDLAQRKSHAQPSRSVFPLDCVHSFTFNEGAICPVDVIPTVPGDSFDLGYSALVSTVNPFVDRMFSGMRLYFHAYYMKCEHIWRGWKNYATKGRRGNISLSLPRVSFDGLSNTSASPDNIPSPCLLSSGNQAWLLGTNTDIPPRVHFDVPHGLPAFMGAPIHRMAQNSSVGSMDLYENIGVSDNSQINRSFGMMKMIDTKWVSTFGDDLTANQNPPACVDLNALPFGMYQRVFRDYYLNKNLCKDNPMWFPDDDEEFILPYSSSMPVVCMNELKPQYLPYRPVPNNETTVFANNQFLNQVNNETVADGPTLCALRYRQYDGDLFTTGLPFLERGGITDMFLSVIQAVQDYNSLLASAFGPADGTILKGMSLSGSSRANTAQFEIPDNPKPNTYFNTNTIINPSTNEFYRNTLGVFINQNKLSELAVYSLWSQRNAHTDGDYNSLVAVHFGVNPNSDDRHPIYIGGSVQRLTFSEILQQSESATTPLGTQAARAYSAGSASFGHFECPDFGYIMILASMVPDTYYTTGLPDYLDPDITGAELPYPEFNSLPPQPLLNKRLYATKKDTAHTLAADNENLFNYVEPFIEYKYRMNKMHGLLAVNPYTDKKFGSMSWSRFYERGVSNSSGTFVSRPEFNNDFVTAYTPWMNQAMYSVPSQPHYILQFASNVRSVRPFPFISQQANYTNIA